MNAYVTSDRAARLTTSAPAQTKRNASEAAAPHCPGETHTRLVKSSIATMPPFVGLKTCLPLTRITNFPAIVTIAATIASASSLVRNSRQSDRPEISALRAVDVNGAPLPVE